MLLQILVKDKTMEGIVTKCNMINLKGGISYNYTPFVFDGKFFYTTYMIDIESNEVFRKVSTLERRNTAKK